MLKSSRKKRKQRLKRRRKKKPQDLLNKTQPTFNIFLLIVLNCTNLCRVSDIFALDHCNQSKFEEDTTWDKQQRDNSHVTCQSICVSSIQSFSFTAKKDDSIWFVKCSWQWFALLLVVQRYTWCPPTEML